VTGVNSKQWLVSYHGMGKYNAMDIAEKGYRLTENYRYPVKEGIFTTPELRLAKEYATRFEHEGAKYLVLFENRINPKHLLVIDSRHSDDDIYWVSKIYHTDESNHDFSELIRPYGIWIFKV
jgi:hypothetical protein